MTGAPPVLALPRVTPALAGRLAEGLDQVDALLRRSVDHEDSFIAAASGHLLQAGGKRFRPLLTLLCAEVCGGVTGEAVAAAAGVELTHLASLYHDDVMDEATVRRAVPSVNAAYDNTTAILVGDLLFGKASEIVARLGAEAVLIQAQTFVRLCSGQIRDTRPAPAGSDPVDYYLGVLADKTGVLIGTAAQYGAMFARQPAAPWVVQLLRGYGELLGVAFQLADDLIDITSESVTSGKTPGTDLREGVDTLAILYAKQSTESHDARLLHLLASDLRDDALHAEALALLRAHPAVARARERTRHVGRDALAELTALPDSDAKAALGALVESVVERVG